MSAFPISSTEPLAENNVADDFALVDSHCHLDFFLDERDNGKRNNHREESEQSKDKQSKDEQGKDKQSKDKQSKRELPRLAEVLARAYRANVRTLLTIATDFSQHPHLVSLCEHYEGQPQTRVSETDLEADLESNSDSNMSSENEHSDLRLFCSAGTHPTNLSEDPENAPSPEQLVAAHSNNPTRIIAFGESGLDFFRSSNPPKSLQYASFHNHIIAAQETQVPLVIHNRNADLELERVLAQTQSSKPYPCILHCFAGSERLASFALELGCCKLSFAGLATYPSARALEGIIKKIPLSRLLLETDSPFLPPQNNSPRSKSRRASHCEPAMLRITAEHIASLKDLPLRELARATRCNFASLFDLAL